MSKSKVTVTFPMGGLLFLVFLVLKLTHVIDWSWWWITAPLWAPFALVFGVATIVGVIGLLTFKKPK